VKTYPGQSKKDEKGAEGLKDDRGRGTLPGLPDEPFFIVRSPEAATPQFH
jgi:hypothetical protein